jgi:diguanylate cyclase (GGDEF)-like protein/PAS domain S-box-containing protein
MATKEASGGPLRAAPGLLGRIRARIGCDRRRRLCWSATAAACAFVLVALIWAVTLERIRYERQDAIEDAFRENSNLTLALEEHTIRTLKGVEQALRYLSHESRQSAGFSLPRLIERGVLGDSLFHFIGVTDERGRVLTATAAPPDADLGDRDYFLAHVAPGGGPFIGRPLVGRYNGKPAIPVSVRVDKPGGGFAGVVFVGVDPAYFTAFYQKSDLGENGVITLVRTDGVTLARRAGQQGTFGQDMSGSTLMAEQKKKPSGAFWSLGKIEGVPRFYSYRTLQDYPLVVALGTSQADTFKEFDRRQRNYHWIAGYASVVVVVFTIVTLALLLRQGLARDRLTRLNARFAAIFNQAAVGIAVARLDGTFVQVNQTYCSMLGYSEEELVGHRYFGVLHPEERPRGAEGMKTMQVTGESFLPPMEMRHIRKDGSVLWALVAVALVRDQDADCLVAVVQDATERKAAEAALRRQAHYDALTDLPNRVLCFDRLKQAIGQARRKKWNVSFLFLDLDRFKPVNDTLGHDAGDMLLIEAGRRLSEAVRGGDTVARIGGDEFGVVLSELAQPQDASIVAHKILDALARPFHLKGHDVFVTGSIGIASYPSDSGDADELIKNADAALFRAKLLGRNNHQFYTAEMNARALEKLQLENQLRQALERREFLLHYQPKIDLASGNVTGVEALLRWKLPGNGLVSPAEFVPLLEESGLIVPVGEWVLESACTQARAWRDAGLGPVPVAVNLSAKQFRRQDLCAAVTRALGRSGIDPAALELEITESAAMENPEGAVATLGELHRLGVHLSIDDFGTGYSSLSYLKRFPLDSLKIDRSFVTGLPGDADDISIARAVIAMAHSLDMKVVAEGVETEPQRAFLSINGCDQIQGYLISRPLDAEQCTRYLRDRRERPRAGGAKPGRTILAA